MGKSSSAFRTISEVADELQLPQHVLRFWETKFSQIQPLRRGGGRRYYRPEDLQFLRRLQDLLHHQGLTIRGAQKLFEDEAQAQAKANKATASGNTGDATGNAAADSPTGLADNAETKGSQPTSGNRTKETLARAITDLEYSRRVLERALQ